MNTRRRFLTGMAGILATGIAPAVLPSGIIMPIRQIVKPSDHIIIVDPQNMRHAMGKLEDQFSFWYTTKDDGITWQYSGTLAELNQKLREVVKMENWAISLPEAQDIELRMNGKFS